MKIREALDWFEYKCSYCGTPAIQSEYLRGVIVPGFCVAVIFDDTFLLCPSCLKRHRKFVSKKVELAKPWVSLPECEPECEVDGCDRKLVAKGRCQLHYVRWKKGLPVDGPTPQRLKRCQVNQCVKKSYCRNYCHMHYSRWRRGTSMEPPPRRKGICAVPNCLTATHGRGFCYEHWKLFHRGIPVGAPGTVTRICDVEGCDNPHWGRGWCRHHYGLMRHSLPDSQCKVTGCDRAKQSKDYCQFHFRRFKAEISFDASFRTNGTMRSNNTKLNPEKVRMILSSEEPSRILAERLGVSKSTIYLVRKRKVWAWVHPAEQGK